MRAIKSGNGRRCDTRHDRGGNHEKRGSKISPMVALEAAVRRTEEWQAIKRQHGPVKIIMQNGQPGPDAKGLG
jgi:hypothetical protein